MNSPALIVVAALLATMPARAEIPAVPYSADYAFLKK